MAAVTLGALALTACGGDNSSTDAGAGSDLGLVSEGTLTVCSEVPYVPFEYVENGEYTGFDIDLIREIASGMGLETEIQQQGFEAIQGGTAVSANMCDLSASAVTITPERSERLLFSDPYYASSTIFSPPSTTSRTPRLWNTRVTVNCSRPSRAAALTPSFRTSL